MSEQAYCVACGTRQKKTRFCHNCDCLMDSIAQSAWLAHGRSAEPVQIVVRIQRVFPRILFIPIALGLLFWIAKLLIGGGP